MESNLVADISTSMGGDPTEAVLAAKGYSLEGWIAWQTTQTAATGAAALAIPVAHLPAMAADFAILIHKMAYCSWGVGSILNVPVDWNDDFAGILAYWSGAVAELAAAMAMAGVAAGGTIAAAAAAPQLVGKAATKGVGFIAGNVTAEAMAKVGMKAGAKAGAKLAGVAAERLVEKSAMKIAAKIGAKFGAKGVAGWIPIVGPAVGAGVNTIIMVSIAIAPPTATRPRRGSTLEFANKFGSLIVRGICLLPR